MTSGKTEGRTGRTRGRTTRALLLAGLVIGSAAVGLVSYYGRGYSDAMDDARSLSRRASIEIAAGRSPEDLGPGRAAMVLEVQDPAFLVHEGSDYAGSGGGRTTVTQSLAARMAFEQFRPGVAELRRSGYARGLEAGLDKRRILTLWLDSVDMGRGPEGWLRGIFAASQAIYGKPPAQLSDREFLRLVAVATAPGAFQLMEPDPALDERVARIERLLAGHCRPQGREDVTLDGCAKAPELGSTG